MKRYEIPPFDRLATISVAEGLALLASGEKHVMVAGTRVRTDSIRLKTFLHKGVKCAFMDCTYVGSFFAVERTTQQTHYHLNLWGITEDGIEVLFTHDHILARGLGGNDSLENSQTMCCWHNTQKAGYESNLARDLWRAHRPEFRNNILSFTYVTAGGKSIVMRTSNIVRKTFNFYLNDPSTWQTMDFLKLVWRHAGFLCCEIRLVNNTYVHPVYKKLAHRYDLFFMIGHGLQTNEEVNKLMHIMERDIRETLNVYFSLGQPRPKPDSEFAVIHGRFP